MKYEHPSFWQVVKGAFKRPSPAKPLEPMILPKPVPGKPPKNGR